MLDTRFLPKGGFFRGPWLAIEEGLTIYVKLVLYVESQCFRDAYCPSKDMINAILNVMSLLQIDICVTFISELE